jgi:DNA-binding transcriptional ArsR family regulator
VDAVLHALADESRRTVLKILRDHPATAGELAEALPIARPGVSRHLRVLREAGLVDVRQDAQHRIYSLRAEALAEVDGPLDRADARTRVAPALGRAHPGLPGDGDRVMSDGIRLSATTVNAPDALALASFYAELARGITKGSAHWTTVSGPDGFIAFQQVDDFRPPMWPAADVPTQMHLDFFVDDLEATGARAIAAGATLLDFQPNSDHCFGYADPAGNPFCLSTWDGPRRDDKPDEAAGN